LKEVSCVFVDGDHSIQGVCRDVVAYLPLIENGGVIAFHDVNGPATRINDKTAGAWAGGVPWLWKRIIEAIPDAKQAVARVGQEGFGIGWVVVNAQSRPVLEAIAGEELRLTQPSHG